MQKSDILKIYKQSNLIHNLREIKNDSEKELVLCSFECEVNILGKEETLKIIVHNSFPIITPSYLLTSKVNYLPHLSPNGNVCYMQNEGVLWDIENPQGILVESLEKAIKTIEQGVLGENKADFSNEFEYYWAINQNKLKESFFLYFELSDLVKKVSGISINSERHFYDTKSDLLRFHHVDIKIFKNKKINKNHAIYIPLKKGTNLIPPEQDVFWTREEITDIIFQNISKENEKRLKEELKKKSGQNKSLLIIMLPLSNGAKAVFGMFYRKITNKKYHPLLYPKSYAVVNPFIINRMDKELILPRGGANCNLNDKKVVIIGCGSIGGYIATELVKTGMLNLSLIDNDVLSKDNIFRHQLGKKYIQKPKVEALKNEIEQNIPYTKVVAFPEKIENVIKNKKINFKKYDLVIVATGEPTINFYLNRYFIENHKNLPVIYTWLDPYGLGGHALLTNNKNKEGCYKCIYRDEFSNIVSFTEKNQKFTKTLSGCGSLFTPYGSVDALETALLTIRLATSVLQGKEDDNPVLSWKGDSSEFEEKGFILSNRYKEQSSEDLFKKRYSYKNKSCPICSTKNKK